MMDKGDLEDPNKENTPLHLSEINSGIAHEHGPSPAMKATLIPYSSTEEELETERHAVELASSSLPSILVAIGGHELFMLSLYRAVIVELIGTASFMYVHIAIVLAAQNYSYPPWPIAVAHGVLLTVFILQFAMSSGAHFNSMITISSVFTGHMPLVRGILYVVVQVIGAIVGSEIMRRTISPSTAKSIDMGTCSTGDFSGGQALALEIMFNMIMLYTVYGTAYNLGQREIYGPILPPFIIGAVVSI